MVYKIEVFRDAALSERVESLSLSARSDAIALEQAEAARWKCECAGRSRVLVLTREDGAVAARMGSRRLSGYGGGGPSAQGQGQRRVVEQSHVRHGQNQQR